MVVERRDQTTQNSISRNVADETEINAKRMCCVFGMMAEGGELFPKVGHRCATRWLESSIGAIDNKLCNGVYHAERRGCEDEVVEHHQQEELWP